MFPLSLNLRDEQHCTQPQHCKDSFDRRTSLENLHYFQSDVIVINLPGC